MHVISMSRLRAYGRKLHEVSQFVDDAAGVTANERKCFKTRVGVRCSSRRADHRRRLAWIDTIAWPAGSSRVMMYTLTPPRLDAKTTNSQPQRRCLRLPAA
jgi:hypothetical protein